MENNQLKMIIMALLSQPMAGREFNETEIKALNANADIIINACPPEETVTPTE